MKGLATYPVAPDEVVVVAQGQPFRGFIYDGSKGRLEILLRVRIPTLLPRVIALALASRYAGVRVTDHKRGAMWRRMTLSPLPRRREV